MSIHFRIAPRQNEGPLLTKTPKLSPNQNSSIIPDSKVASEVHSSDHQISNNANNNQVQRKKVTIHKLNTKKVITDAQNQDSTSPASIQRSIDSSPETIPHISMHESEDCILDDHINEGLHFSLQSDRSGGQ